MVKTSQFQQLYRVGTFTVNWLNFSDFRCCFSTTKIVHYDTWFVPILSNNLIIQIIKMNNKHYRKPSIHPKKIYILQPCWCVRTWPCRFKRRSFCIIKQGLIHQKRRLIMSSSVYSESSSECSRGYQSATP